MLNVTVPWGLGQIIQEVDSGKVPVGDSEQFLRQCLGGALIHSEIVDLEWDETWDDVNRHPDVPHVCDSVGGVQDKGVVGFLRLFLHVLNVPVVDVLLGEGLDRVLFGTDVVILCFNKSPENTMQRFHLNCENNL